MDEFTAEDLSQEETELIIDFIEWVGEFDRQVLDRQTIDGDSEEIGLQQAFEFLVPLISEDASDFDAQMFRLFRLEREIRNGPAFKYEKEAELPEDAKITPDELNLFLKKDELKEIFTLTGQMIETLSIDLIMKEVIAESRRSNSVRQRVERMSQGDREWLLHATGVISDGDKGKIRRAYDLRNSIVHSSENTGELLRSLNIPSDIDRAKDAVNSLHEARYGMKLKHRFSDLIV